jgi:hypothetical protein
MQGDDNARMQAPPSTDRAEAILLMHRLVLELERLELHFAAAQISSLLDELDPFALVPLSPERSTPPSH